MFHAAKLVVRPPPRTTIYLVLNLLSLCLSMIYVKTQIKFYKIKLYHFTSKLTDVLGQFVFIIITQRSMTSSDVILKHISCRVFKQLRPKVKHKQQVVLPLVQRDRSSQMRYRCLLLFLPPPWCALRHNLS